MENNNNTNEYKIDNDKIWRMCSDVNLNGVDYL